MIFEKVYYKHNSYLHYKCGRLHLQRKVFGLKHDRTAGVF
jgi:hypothetical protein